MLNKLFNIIIYYPNRKYDDLAINGHNIIRFLIFLNVISLICFMPFNIKILFIMIILVYRLLYLYIKIKH